MLETVATTRGKTVAQVAINWCICKGAIPIPGVWGVWSGALSMERRAVAALARNEGDSAREL